MVRNKLIGLVVVLLVISSLVGLAHIQRQRGCEAVSYVPGANWNTTWDSKTETLTVIHGGGDEFALNDDEGTIALFVRLTDTDTGNTEKIVWLNESVGNPPVKTGDTVRITQSETTMALAPGDSVHIVWRGNIGYPQLEFWCYNPGVGNHVIGIERIPEHHPGGQTNG